VGALADALLDLAGARADFAGLGLEPAAAGPATLRAAVRGTLAPGTPL